MKTQRRDTDNSLPLLDRLYAARGEAPRAYEQPLTLRDLLSPTSMLGIDTAAELISEAVMAQQHILIAGDYDADGGGASAVSVLGLRAMGAQHVDYLIPDRLTMGYGLSPALAERAAETGAQLLVTVDNGISSIAGVARARALGMTVCVTDHHLPPRVLPDADAIVNPNQPGCPFPSKNLSGCGVILYVLLMVRQRLIAAGWFARCGIDAPNLGNLTDIVALSTVGDMVPLDRNNRALVSHGLRLIRTGRTRPGIEALFRVGGAESAQATSMHFGFVCAPRLNASGRLENMRTGVDCLMAADSEQAFALASELNAMNLRRRELQAQMTDEAHVQLEDVAVEAGIVIHDSSWHEGVVGLVATRIKDTHYRPTIAFADAADGRLKGSGRSIPGFHLRDALALVQSLPDSPIITMGGHAMAAGLSIRADGLGVFTHLFEDVCDRQLSREQLERITLTDGELDPSEINMSSAYAIESAGPWGQGFEEPLFEGHFRVEAVRLMGAEGQHARYQVRAGTKVLTAVHFNSGEHPASVGDTVSMTYRMAINRWQGNESLQLIADQVA